MTVTLLGGDLAGAESALRVVVKDLREHGGQGLAHFKEFLARKARAARKAAELQKAKMRSPLRETFP